MTCKEALQATAVTGYLEMVHSVRKEDGLKRQREHIARVLELQRDQSPHEVYQGRHCQMTSCLGVQSSIHDGVSNHKWPHYDH